MLEIDAVDYHTGGEPFRIVTGQELRGETILEKRRDAAERLDHLRRLLVNEPRGHADMYGCFVTEPEDEGADLGVVFFHNAGYSTACGHGTIALVTWALESACCRSRETRRASSSTYRPAGSRPSRASATATCSRCASATCPAFVWDTDVLPGVDVAFGGAFYASVEERVEPRASCRG